MASYCGLCADTWHRHGSDLANTIGDEGGEVLEVKGEDMKIFKVNYDGIYTCVEPIELNDELAKELLNDTMPEHFKTFNKARSEALKYLRERAKDYSYAINELRQQKH